MNIDFTNIDTDSKFTIYPAGAYEVKINSIEEVIAKSSGNTQLRVKAIISSGEFQGKPITDHITLVESCAWKLAKFVNGCNVDIKKVGKIDTDSVQFRNLLNKLIGRSSVWVITQEKDRNGLMRNVLIDFQPNPNVQEAADDVPDFLDNNEVKWDD